MVYGDERLWRWWVVDEFILWLHAGPYEDSKLPPLDEMGALVEASTTSPRPVSSRVGGFRTRAATFPCGSA